MLCRSGVKDGSAHSATVLLRNEAEHEKKARLSNAAAREKSGGESGGEAAQSAPERSGSSNRDTRPVATCKEKKKGHLAKFEFEGETEEGQITNEPECEANDALAVHSLYFRFHLRG